MDPKKGLLRSYCRNFKAIFCSKSTILFLVEYSALVRREEELERLMKEALSKEVQMEKTLTNLTEQLEARGNIL